VGVRGSDFAVCVSYVNPLNTTLVTGPDTTVLFAGDVGPAQVVGPMQAAAAPAGAAATPGLGVSAYPPPMFGAGGPPPGAGSAAGGGLSQGAYWGIAGGLAVGAGVLAAGDDDDDSTALTVTADPPAGTNTGGEGLDIRFTFSKPINTVNQDNFNVTPVSMWNLGTPLIQDATTVIVPVFPISAGGAFTIQVVNITATDGSILEGQTSFTYPF
jgi:hypothetical protein